MTAIPLVSAAATTPNLGPAAAGVAPGPRRLAALLRRIRRGAGIGLVGYAACALALVPLGLGLSIDGTAADRVDAASILVGMTRVVALGVLAAALYLDWRVRKGSSVGWLCACAAACAFYGGPFALVAAVTPHDADLAVHASEPGPLIHLGTVVFVVLAWREVRTARWLNPLYVGGLVGLVLAAMRAVWVTSGPDAGSLPVTLEGHVIVGLLIAVLVAGVRSVPRWFRVAFVGVILAGTGSVVMLQLGPGAMSVSIVALVVDAGAAVLLVFLVLRSLGDTQRAHAAETMQAVRSAADAQASLEAGEEMLHELRSTLAGLAAASHVLQRGDEELGVDRASRLGAMLVDEIDRVERLLSPVPRSEERICEVGATVGAVVECSRAAGQVVIWDPQPAWVHMGADDVAEVIGILLSNARRHAAGSPVEIWMQTSAGQIELHVRDRGPGVATGLEGTIFERGVRQESSPGDGLGLHIAHRIVSDARGSLGLVRTDVGAHFVLRLEPAPTFSALESPVRRGA